MAEPRVEFQKKVEGATLEISGEGDRLFGHVIYPYPDPRFEQGGMDTVFAVIAALLPLLRENEPLEAFFVGELGLAVDEGSGHAALAHELSRRLTGRREGAMGVFERFEGVWMTADEGVSMLRDLAPRFAPVIAESAEARFLLLDRQADDASGWDIIHRDGITVIGRWDGNLGEGTPGALEPGDLSPLEAIFGRLAQETLSPLLGTRA